RVNGAARPVRRSGQRLLLHVQREGGVPRALQRVRLLLPGQRDDGRQLLLKSSALAALVSIFIACGGAKTDASPDAPDGGFTPDHVDASAHDADAAVDALETSPEADASDPSALVVFPAQFTEQSMPMRMLGDGDPVDLWNAPQGGHVVLFGAKV